MVQGPGCMGREVHGQSGNNPPTIWGLVKNPFLLTLVLKALSGFATSSKVLSSIRITCAGLYDMFVDQMVEDEQGASLIQHNDQGGASDFQLSGGWRFYCPRS
jgi:hypothetical protein